MSRPVRARAFTLVEILVALAVIGLALLFLQPNAARARADAEDALMRQRASQLDAATASWAAAVGDATASSAWTAAADDEARYALVRGFLARPPPTLAAVPLAGYVLAFGPSPEQPVRVTRADGSIVAP